MSRGDLMALADAARMPASAIASMLSRASRAGLLSTGSYRCADGDVHLIAGPGWRMAIRMRLTSP